MKWGWHEGYRPHGLAPAHAALLAVEVRVPPLAPQALPVRLVGAPPLGVARVLPRRPPAGPRRRIARRGRGRRGSGAGGPI